MVTITTSRSPVRQLQGEEAGASPPAMIKGDHDYVLIRLTLQVTICCTEMYRDLLESLELGSPTREP